MRSASAKAAAYTHRAHPDPGTGNQEPGPRIAPLAAQSAVR